MGKDIFVSDPVILNQEGENQLGQGDEFGKDVTTLYNAVDEIAKIYESAGQVAITNDVYEFQDDLKAMRDMFTKYGAFLKHAANKTNANEEDIVSNFKRHEN